MLICFILTVVVVVVVVVVVAVVVVVCCYLFHLCFRGASGTESSARAAPARRPAASPIARYVILCYVTLWLYYVMVCYVIV